MAYLKPGISALAMSSSRMLRGRMADVTMSGEASRLAAGVPESLAERAGVWPLLHTGVRRRSSSPERTGRRSASSRRCYWGLFDALDLMWLWDAIGALPRSDRWQTQARSALRDDLLVDVGELTEDVRSERSDRRPTGWRRNAACRRSGDGDAHRDPPRRAAIDLTTLSVALRQLRNLALTSAVGVADRR